MLLIFKMPLILECHLSLSFKKSIRTQVTSPLALSWRTKEKVFNYAPLAGGLLAIDTRELKQTWQKHTHKQ